MIKESSINENAQEDQCHKVVIDSEESSNAKEHSSIVVNQQAKHKTQIRGENRNGEVAQIDSTCSTCLPINIIEQPGTQLMVELYAYQEHGLHNNLKEVIKHSEQEPISNHNMRDPEQQKKGSQEDKNFEEEDYIEGAESGQDDLIRKKNQKHILSKEETTDRYLP